MAAPISLSIRSRSAGFRNRGLAGLSCRAITSTFWQSTDRYLRNGRGVITVRTLETDAKPKENLEHDEVRLPRSVQATYLRPLQRKQTHGIPICDLQLRSYSVRNVEFFADFALRAAYYLNMPAAGPIPLPQLVERWTVPRSPFVHKKSQENWERKTLRRLIQIKDAHPETVQIWLAFLRKHQFHGVGMKANVWDYDKISVGEALEANLKDMQPMLEKEWALFGREKRYDKDEKIVDWMHTDKIRTEIEGTMPPKFKA